MRRAMICAALLVLLLPAKADGDGLPVLNIDAGPSGVTAEGADHRYVTLAAGRDTLVAGVRRDGGQVERSRVLRGQLTVPAVALDGTASGLSASGRTLVLIKPRLTFPRDETTFAVLDARSLKVRDTITLRGDFSFDALSPDGRTMYLIHYLSRRDPTRYAVRAFDLERRRLQQQPIVDPREPDERMRGFPVTRATSPDGRWEYTLYDGAAEHPFIHALDTVGREALCIDLDALTGHKRLYGLRLHLAGNALRVRDGGTTLATVDRTSHSVGAAPPPKAKPAPPAETEGTGIPWAPTLAVAAVAAVAATLLARRRSRRAATPA